MTIDLSPSPRGPMTEAELNDLEARAGHRLSDDYRSFMKTMGPVNFGDDGATFDVDWRRIDGQPMAADEDEDFEDDFMLLVLSDAEVIASNIDFLNTAHGAQGPMVPPVLFPFAAQATRGYLLMSLAQSDSGSIYLYYPSNDPYGEGENAYLGYIAPSFSTFLDTALRPYE